LNPVQLLLDSGTITSERDYPSPYCNRYTVLLAQQAMYQMMFLVKKIWIWGENILI
jgi:hypothetical protein